jgi:hypothetical protein
MKNTNIPSWVQPLLVGIGITTFSIGTTLFLKMLSDLNYSVNQSNVINEKLNGRLEVIQVEIQSLKEFKTVTERNNSERDKTVIRLEQQVGVLEEKIKVSRKK